jgi:hypothetical protein
VSASRIDASSSITKTTGSRSPGPFAIQPSCHDPLLTQSANIRDYIRQYTMDLRHVVDALSAKAGYLIRVIFWPPQMPIAQPSTRIVEEPSSKQMSRPCARPNDWELVSPKILETIGRHLRIAESPAELTWQ